VPTIRYFMKYGNKHSSGHARSAWP
jgi:hypothetical protein